ncbi:MAG: HEAT repeat domain-containing protein [Candidatus Zixiibacteriota bacterium]|nr:MAG: HEAT repeat domain-containing protein [candidate division Zixibacteria bacterium]
MMTQRVSPLHKALGYSQGEIAALRDLFLSLSKGVRASRQYPSQHQIPTQFKTLFFRKLRNFFESTEILAVKVTHDTLVVEDEVIYKGATASENIAGLLHRDGVRFLEISSGITEQEASSLFEACVTCSGRDEGAEDIVNLFWQAGFEHVTYDVVDVFEVSEMQELREEFDSTRQTAIADDIPPVDDETEPLELPKTLAERFTELAAYSPEETATLEEMAESDRAVDAKSQVIDLLLLMCESSDSPQDISQIVEALQSIFDKTIQAANFPGMTVLLHRIRELLDSGDIESPTAKKRLTDFIYRCGDSLRIKMIVEALNRHEDLDLQPARQYLSELGWESFNHLLWMLGELAFFPARKMVCDLLVEKGIDKIDLLGSAVFDSRWYLVRNVVWVLGETGHPRAIGFLRRVAAHPELRIRIEVVKALGKISDPSRIELLLALTQDEDEQIRTMVAEELGRTESESAFVGLRGIVLSKDFVKAPPTEMRKLIDAMVASGGVAAVETIREVLDRSPLFNRAPVRRLQDTALSALKRSATTEALEMLTRLANDTKSRYSLTAKKLVAQRQFKQEKRVDDESA